MKKILYYFICFLCYTAFSSASASTIVDYKEIENYVNNNRSGYDALVKRFESGDTLLTNDEIAKIYYGSFFAGHSSPYSRNDTINKAYKNRDYAKAFKMSKKYLKSNPVDLEVLLILFVSSESLKHEDDALNAKRRFNQIISMIFDAGDGSEENPFKVICVADEYAIMRTCYDIKEFKGQTFTQKLCDRMNVVLDNNDEKTVYIYFDISLAFNRLSKSLE